MGNSKSFDFLSHNDRKPKSINCLSMRLKQIVDKIVIFYGQSQKALLLLNVLTLLKMT